ncbi:transposase family protein, partial [Microcystis aeruginosa]|uniref:transposase family protein n=1 Tax=Microcystis aeruginosa TaxID=1126 RepID=UPI0020A61519
MAFWGCPVLKCKVLLRDSTFLLENIGIVFRIESKNQKVICPRCGLESDKLHQNHRHLVKDLPISGQPVYLQVNRRQFKCDNCRK